MPAFCCYGIPLTVEDGFGGEIGYAMLHKQYSDISRTPQRRDSAATVTGIETKTIMDDPYGKFRGTTH
jgi:hypothetical protein